MKLSDQIEKIAAELNVNKIQKEYFKLFVAIRKEKQFNKKVDLNKKILSFIKNNKLKTKENFPIHKVYKDNELLMIIHMNDENPSKIWMEKESAIIYCNYKKN